MKKVGEYWVPDIDMRLFRNRRKTLKNYQNGGHGSQIGHLDQALDVIEARIGRTALAAGVALDAGANVGAYARRMAGRMGHVHALEPAADTHACLARNVQEWGLSDRITVHQKAVSDVPARVGMAGGGWFRRSISREVSGSGDIEAVPLDNLGATGVVLMKLDVEGFEVKALQGAREILARDNPFVMMELKQRKLDKGTADLRAHEFLLAQGYRIIADLGEPVLDRLYAREA